MLLQVGTATVEPTDGQLYDPTDGATTDPTDVLDVGTTRPDGAVPLWFGRTMTCRWERCTVVASVEAQKVINKHRAKTERIVFAPADRGRLCAAPQLHLQNSPLAH